MFTSLYDFLSNTVLGLFSDLYSVFEFFALTPMSELTVPDSLPSIVEVTLDLVLGAFASAFGGDNPLLLAMAGTGLTTYIVVAIAKWGIDIFK